MWNANKIFIFSHKKEILIALLALLLIQFTFDLFFLSRIPLQYDEWYSYIFFSGSSLWTLISSYPAPNNHIFYNVIAHFMILPRINSQIAMRIPSLIVSIVGAYYFFKMCRFYFAPLVSLILLAFLLCHYHFILYSFQARGYAFVNLFCILMMYSANSLSQNYCQTKYRLLLISSTVLGAYTLPSFLYVIVPTYFVLGLYFLSKRSYHFIGKLVLDSVFSLLLIVAVYIPVLFNNDLENLLHPKGEGEGFSFSNTEWLHTLSYYFETKFFELFGFYYLFATCFAIVFSALACAIFQKSRSQFLNLLCVFMFFSPLVFVVLQGVFPFARTWLFLVFPLLVCLGMMLEVLVFAVKNITKQLPTIFLSRIILICLVFFPIYTRSHFEEKHRNYFQWDHAMDWLGTNKLAPLSSKIRTIATTRLGFEFYPADFIYFYCRNANPGVDIFPMELLTVENQDVLVIDGTLLEKYRNALKDYSFLYEHENIWIYVSNRLVLN